jgi:hypothetical protein
VEPSVGGLGGSNDLRFRKSGMSVDVFDLTVSFKLIIY